jgi:nitroreductase/Pyruvate/2-oxoacid:ferredoxin oxidoreductase delta subunit
MALLTVDKETCTKCGLCAIPCGLIIFKEGSYPRPIPQIEQYCMRCGHCIGYCPTGALTHQEMPDTPKIEKSLEISFEQCAQLIKSRRSIREYKDKAVPKKEIERIIDVARYAPTGHNMQGVRWMVINDREKVRQIAAIGADWLRLLMKSSPQMAEMFKGIDVMLDAGKDMFLQGAPAVVLAYAEKNNQIASVDCVIALSYFDLIAKSAGLGCCWAGFMMMAAATYPDMIKALALPEGFTPYGALMVGYPKYKYQRIPARKPANIIYCP